MLAALKNTWSRFTRFRGDTTRLRFTLTDETGTVFNPTGHTLMFTVKSDPAAADGAALVQKISSVGGFYTINASAGIIEVELVSEDYEDLAVGTTYELDVQAQSGAGAVRTVGRGWLTIEQDVTKGTTLAVPSHTTETPGNPLASRVPMPANTAAAGEVGQYAVNAETLAIYVEGTGWVFFTGYQI